MAWIAWNLEIDWPNALRSLAYFERLVERALGEAEAHGGHADATAVERLEELLEALAPRAHQVLLGHPAVLEASGRVSEAFQPILR